SVTYGGTSMTKAGLEVTYGAGPDGMYIYGLSSPPSGTQTIAITMSTGATYFTNALAISVKGSDLTTIFRNYATNSGSGTSLSNSLTSAPNDLVIDIGGVYDNTATLTPGGSQTTIWNVGGNGTGASRMPGVAGTASVAWTSSNSDPWGEAMVSVKHQ